MGSVSQQWWFVLLLRHEIDWIKSRDLHPSDVFKVIGIVMVFWNFQNKIEDFLLTKCWPKVEVLEQKFFQWQQHCFHKLTCCEFVQGDNLWLMLCGVVANCIICHGPICSRVTLSWQSIMFISFWLPCNHWMLYTSWRQFPSKLPPTLIAAVTLSFSYLDFLHFGKHGVYWWVTRGLVTEVFWSYGQVSPDVFWYRCLIFVGTNWSLGTYTFDTQIQWIYSCWMLIQR